MRYFAFIALIMLAGCSASSTTVPADAAGAVRAAVALLEKGIGRQDVFLASQPVGEHFFLGPNVALRYSAAEFSTDTGISARGRFRSFFSDSFDVLDNVTQRLVVTDVTVTGEVATATVESRLDAVRVDQTPAENISFSTTDYMLFELQRGAWLLTRWDEVAPPGTGGDGSGEGS